MWLLLLACGYLSAALNTAHFVVVLKLVVVIVFAFWQHLSYRKCCDNASQLNSALSLNLWVGKHVILTLENVCLLETWKCCYLDTLLVGHLETWNFVVASPLFGFKGTKVTTNGGNLSLRWESHPLPTLIRYGSSSDPLQRGQVDNPQQSLDNAQTPRACQVLGK